MKHVTDPFSVLKVASMNAPDYCCFAKAAYTPVRPSPRTQTLPPEIPLHELRQARGLTQQVLAGLMNVKQPVVSHLEHQGNMRILTMRSLIEAMGGKLEIVASFPEGKVKISNY